MHTFLKCLKSNFLLFKLKFKYYVCKFRKFKKFLFNYVS